MRSGATPRAISAAVATPVPGPSSRIGPSLVDVDLRGHRAAERPARRRDGADGFRLRDEAADEAQAVET